MTSTVLVAGSANVTGMNVIRALSGSTYNVVGYDCCPTNQNPANIFCVNETVPRASDSGYAEAVSKLAQKHNARFIIASNDHDVRGLASHATKFARCGVTINAMTSMTTEFLDKLQTSRHFTAASIPTPMVLDSSYPSLPCVIRKKCVGEGKKYTFIIKDQHDLSCATWWPDVVIATRYVEGDEYTVDVLAHKGHVVSVVPRLRREVRHGMVHFGEVVKDDEVIDWTRKIAQSLSFDGIYCIQCIKNADGCHFFEVNPRPGSGLDLTTAAGINMPLMWVMLQDGYSPDSFTVPEPVWGTKMVRYSSGYYFR